MLFFGKTADLFGCKLQLLAGLAFLSVTSLGTAFVPSPIGLNVLCGFLGLGTAVISPPAIGTLFATYPEGRRRNMATGALGCGNPIGFILGSVSSGIATKYSSWRASFVVIAIFFAMLAVSSFWTMPSTPRSGSLRSETRNFDYLGTVLTVVGFALVSAGLTYVPSITFVLGLKSFQGRPSTGLELSPSRHNAPLWCFLPCSFCSMGGLLPISTAEPGGVEEQNLYSLHLVRFLWIHVVHYQPVLGLAVYARSTTPIWAPNCCTVTATGTGGLHLELCWSGSSFKNSREINHGNWWICLLSWSHTASFRSAGHELLVAIISVIMHHSHWS